MPRPADRDEDVAARFEADALVVARDDGERRGLAHRARVRPSPDELALLGRGRPAVEGGAEDVGDEEADARARWPSMP